MKNPQIGRSEKRKIDKAVSRLLSDLKGIEPPLDLAMVRDQLNLDLEYYRGNDPTFLKEIIHSIKIAGKEIFTDKTKLGKLITKMGLRGMLFWDQNRILIDEDLHHIKYRWAEAHEIGHKLLFWHKYFLLGDTNSELSLTCHATIEAEANYTGGQLLFLQDRFVEEAMSYPVSIDSLKILKKRFGNSNASTFWRMVEEYAGPEPVVGIISEHPHFLSDEFDPALPCRYVIESQAFRERFCNTTERQLFNVLTQICSRRHGGELATEEVELKDNNGERHLFVFESFCFRYNKPDGTKGYNVLTLAVHQRELSKIITV